MIRSILKFAGAALRILWAVCCGMAGSNVSADTDEDNRDDMPPRYGFIPNDELEALMPVLPPGQKGL